MLAVGICLTAAFVFKKSKTAAEIPAKMLWACIEEKTNMHEAAQTRKEVAPPNTRAFDNLKTDADRRHERLQSCMRHLHRGASLPAQVCDLCADNAVLTLSVF